MDNVLFRSRKTTVKDDGVGIRAVIMQLVFVVLSGFLLYNVVKSIDITVKKLGILSQAEVEVDELRLKNIELILEQQRVESKDYIETEARNRLNYAQDDDILYVIPDAILEQNMKKVEQILNEDDQKERSKTSREIWYEFFVNGV